MLAYTYIKQGKFELIEKPKPELRDSRDAIVRVTLGSICTSDLHIKHGGVPRAVPGITVGHEMVGIVEQTGRDVKLVKPGDRVTVNVETFCGECFFCRHGYVNNCADPNGGWALGCRIDGGQTEYVRVPYADQGLNLIPDSVSDEQALFVGDILATGFWAARISEITEEDTVLVIGAGPTGICTLLCVMLRKPQRIVVCEQSSERIRFVREHYPQVEVVTPEECKEFVLQSSPHGGADVVFEVAGGEDTFRLAWECARPNAVVILVALYDRPQILPLPDMYGKNLTFKTEEDTVLVIGAGPTGICTLLCVMLRKPQRIVVCEQSSERIRFVREHYPQVEVVTPEECKEFVLQSSPHGGADVVFEVAGGEDTFRLAWECARPNAVVILVALYDRPQILPLPDMYGKNLTFKTGGVDGCDCAEILRLIEMGKIDTTPLITHRFPLDQIETAYQIFENRQDGVIKVAVTMETGM